jgi:hypothetical protein
MAQLIKTSAYVRRDAQGNAGRSGGPPFVIEDQTSEQAIWSKLTSAHTVESLAKALDRELDGDMPTRERRIETTLKRWLDKDLIELATDS